MRPATPPIKPNTNKQRQNPEAESSKNISEKQLVLDKKFEIKSMEELYLEDEVEKQKLNSYENEEEHQNELNNNIDKLVNSLSPNNNEINFNNNAENNNLSEDEENVGEYPETRSNNKEENLDLVESISHSLPVSY